MYYLCKYVLLILILYYVQEGYIWGRFSFWFKHIWMDDMPLTILHDLIDWLQGVFISLAPPAVSLRYNTWLWKHPALLLPRRRRRAAAARRRRCGPTQTPSSPACSLTGRSGGNVMDVRTPSEAARRVPQMAEWVRMRLPSSIFVSVSLFTAETTAALYLSSTYRSAGDQIWQGLTLLFTLVPSVLVQLTLTFIHRDLGRDRPLVVLLHILQLGPIVRSVPCCLSLWLAHTQALDVIVSIFADTWRVHWWFFPLLKTCPACLAHLSCLLI